MLGHAVKSIHGVSLLAKKRVSFFSQLFILLFSIEIQLQHLFRPIHHLNMKCLVCDGEAKMDREEWIAALISHLDQRTYFKMQYDSISKVTDKMQSTFFLSLMIRNVTGLLQKHTEVKCQFQLQNSDFHIKFQKPKNYLLESFQRFVGEN